MIEERVQQVIEIETQATAAYEAAVHDAEALVEQAKKDAQGIVEQARTEAQDQAQKTVENAHAMADAASKPILKQADSDAERMEASARGRFDRAVTFVLNRVAGSE